MINLKDLKPGTLLQFKHSSILSCWNYTNYYTTSQNKYPILVIVRFAARPNEKVNFLLFLGFEEQNCKFLSNKDVVVLVKFNSKKFCEDFEII